jgi:hypothetical protein
VAGRYTEGMPHQQVKKVRLNFVRSLPLIEGRCPHCHTMFTGVKGRVYCSASCKGRAAYAAHAEQRRANRRAKYHAERGKK